MEPISRGELWRRDYRSRRYMEHASEDQLAQRIRDLSCNLTLLTEDGKLGLRLPENGGAEWMEKFTHALEEYSLRGIGFQPNFIEKAVLPKPTYPNRPKSAGVIEGRHLSPNSFLIKYGKQKYLKDGSIRISAASSWLKSENPAIHDDELKKSFFAHPADVVIQVHQSRNSPAGHRIKPIGNVAFTHNANGDYYALCVSCVYDHRLFDDFEADCCLIIHNPLLFGKRLEAAMREQLPDWAMFSCSMGYYDPFNTKRSEVNVHWSKDFKFWYQQEFRFAWIRSGITAELAPVDVVVDPITDFGELIYLK